jgi:subfamily B ATP-binding cassette protein MsbA
LKKVLKRYLPYILEYKFYYFLVLVGIILTVSATAATSYIMKPMMDEMFIAKKESMIYIIPVSLVLIYIVKSLGRYIQSIYMAYIGTHIISRFREMLLEKIIFLDFSFLYSKHSGELISRITNDISRIQYFVANLLPELIRESLTVIALIGYVIYLNYHLAFYAFVIVPAVVYPLFIVAKKLKKYSHRSQERGADILSRLSEIFNNVEMIKISSTEEEEVKRFDDVNWKFFKINMKSVYIGELFFLF